MAFGLSAGAISLLGMGAGALAGSQGGSQTQTKDPWGPAQDWMKSNIGTGQKLQDYYQKNPFNDQQKTSYQNLFGDLDNFRQNTAPGLMSFANNAMNSGGYQRQQLSAPGQGGYRSAGQAGQPVARNLEQQMQPTGPFSVNPGRSYGLLDLNAQNPFTNGGIKAPEAPVVQPQTGGGMTQEQLFEWLRQNNQLGGDGGGSNGGIGGPGGIGGGSVW